MQKLMPVKFHRMKMIAENIVPASEPLSHVTLNRCWLAIRMNWQPARSGASEHARPAIELLQFLRERAESIPNDLTPNGKVLWRPLQQLIEKHFRCEQKSGLVFAQRMPALAPKDSGGVDFYEACSRGDLSLVESMMSSPIGADAVNTPSGDRGEYPLALAAQNGHIEVVYSLLQREPVLEASDKSGNTALHYAASGGHLRIVELLLDAGTLHNIENAYGETPLHFACRSSRSEVVQLLLEKCTENMTYEPNLRKNDEENDRLRQEAEDALKMEYVRQETRGGFTALHYAAGAPEMGIITSLLLKIGKFSFRALDAVTAFGDTPLDRAARAKCHDSVVEISKWPGPEDPNAKKKKKKESKESKGRAR
jgi:ankyrin repeat protein